jgi:hypothetical protein
VGPARLLQFRLELFDELVERHRALVERNGLEEIAQGTAAARREKMCEVEIAWMSLWSYGEHANEVQAKVGKVSQGLLTQGLIVQLGADQS